jgi:UDPglucose--hexose-1-phosphate uridylyltransferase
MSLPTGAHRRYNPLLDEWVLCSPGRLRRPWQGRVESTAEEDLPPYDPACYLCPGNARANGARNPAYTSTFAFDNDFPALLPLEPEQQTEKRERRDSLPARAQGVWGVRRSTPPLHDDADGPLVARTVSGRCRVLCFSPRHDLTLALMSPAEIKLVVDAWADESARLGSRDDVAHVQVFENKGEMMGCSNPHPHCQVWATGHVPTLAARRLAGQRRHFETTGSDLLGDCLARELADGTRIVCANEHWVVLVPFWAAWPFETMVVPRRKVADLPALSAEERAALADALSRLNVRYDNLFRTSFPYSMGWHARPTDGAEHPYWRLHASYYPPLLRSATVRKFVVGYELTAEAQRDLTPEEAAERLRESPERHHRLEAAR